MSKQGRASERAWLGTREIWGVRSWSSSGSSARGSSDDGDEEEEEVDRLPAATIAEAEKGAAATLAAAWAANQGGSDTPPVPDDTIRGLIKEYNGLIPELVPADGSVARSAMKVSGNREQDANGPAVMRVRLARALLGLSRVGTGNYEGVNAKFDGALWLRRFRMEVLLRGRTSALGRSCPGPAAKHLSAI